MSEKPKSSWQKELSGKEQRTVIKRLLPYTKDFKADFLIAILFAAILSGINILLPLLLQYYMDNYLQSKSTPLNIMFLFAGLYFIGVILKAITQFIQMYLYSMGAEKTLEKIRVILFKKIHTLGMRYFDKTPAGAVVSRVTNDTMTLADFWTLFMTLIVGVFSLISAFAAMYIAKPQIALVTLIFIPILLITTWYYQRFSSKVYRQMREYLSRLNTKLNESIVGINVIQQFRQEKRIEGEFEDTNELYLKKRFEMIRTNSLLLSPIISLFYALAVVMTLGLFGISSLDHFVEAGMVYAFLTYLQNFFNPMTNLMDYLTTFQDGIVAGSRIISVLDDQTIEPQQTPVAGATITEGKIEFKNVTFSYDNENAVLKNISFTVQPGETLAFVGHTGSGKSSTINVLMRFYDFEEGQILIDGLDIKKYSTEELRKKMGLVLQDSFLFYGNVASNIRMFNQDITDEQIEKAAKFVHADQFIDKLPRQYQTKVVERGATYSAGEKQLISFARTIVTNPKILILDEATANIDTETEQLIQDGLKQMRQNRTTLVIAHRLSTIVDANQILVLDKGQIVERGTHEELLKLNGKYADMYNLQNISDD